MSVEVLKCPARPPAATQPRASSVQSHDQALWRPRQLLHPDARGHGGGRRRGGLPSPGEPPSSCSPTQAGTGAEATPYPAFLQGTSLQGLPQDPNEGVRSASSRRSLFEESSSRLGPPWRQSRLPVCWGVSSALRGAATEGLRMRGPTWAALTTRGTRSVGSQGSLG